MTVGEGRWSKISIKDWACVHHLFMLMMIQINICIRGADNGDMALVSHLGRYGRCQLAAKKGCFPGEEVPDPTGTHRVLQCCTLSGVISHKASLILHQEQLRGL